MKKILLFTLVLVTVSCTKISDSVSNVKIDSNPPSTLKIWSEDKVIIQEGLKTPVELQLKHGTYNVISTTPGYITKSEIITITEDESNLFLELQRETVTLELNIKPYNYDEILINGKRQKRKSEVKPGTYEISVKKEGYTSYNGSVTINLEDDYRRVNITLLNHIQALVTNRDYEQLKQIPDNSIYKSELVDEYEDCAIGQAIQNRDYEMIKFLLDNNFSTLYLGGGPPAISIIENPIRRQDYDMVKFLLENGKDRDIWVDLSFVIHESNTDIIKLFLNSGYDINEYIYDMPNIDEGWYANTPIFAVDSYEKMKVILENGGNPNLVNLRLDNNLGKITYITKTLLGQFSDNQQMTELLLEYGAKKLSDFTLTEIEQQSAGLNSKITVEEVNLYSKPHTNSQVVGTIKNSDEFITIFYKNGWGAVKTLDGLAGWIKQSMIETSSYRSL